METSSDGSRGILPRYATATVAAIAAAGLTLATWPLCAFSPMTFFLGAVAVAAWNGGVGPAFLATVLSIGLADLLLLPPYRTLALGADAAVVATSFAIVSALIAALVASAGRTRTLLRVERLDRRLLDASHDCLKVLSPDGRILSVNEPGLRLLGVDDFETIRGREWALLWSEEARDAARDAVARAAAGETTRLEGSMSVGGEARVWESVLSPVAAVDGKAARIHCVVRDLTERARVEAARRDSEEKYRSLFDAIDQGFCIIEMIRDEAGRAVDFRYLEANPAFAAHTGLADVVGRTASELGLGLGARWFETYGRVAATGEPIRFVDRAERLEGRWFDLYAFPAGGSRVAVLFSNVTETIRAERERDRLLRTLQHERAWLRSLLENAPALIAVMRGPDHVFEFANRRFVALVGDREVIGRTVREAFPDVEGQGWFELLDQAYRTGDLFFGQEMRVRFQTPGGGDDTRFVDVFFQATRDPDGSVTGLMAMGFEVTEQVGARAALRDSEARFRDLAEAIPQVVWTVGPDGELDYLNHRWREYFGALDGLSMQEVAARILHPDDLPRSREAWRESHRAGRPYEAEERLRRADGEYRWHLTRAQPAKDADGRVVRWYGTSTDVDDVKRMSEELRQSDRRKDEFLATLAHELRNPLAPIRSGLQILRLGPSEEAARSMIEMMDRQLGHMVRLIDDLMDVARINSGKIVLRKERTTFRAAAAVAIEATRGVIDERGHSLTVSLPDAPMVLEGDPTRLGQVLTNLLANAAKYTGRGGRIKLVLRRDGDEAVATVKDSGVGLAPEMLPRIFDMFTQVDDSVILSRGGLGIGLTIVKRLVEMHGGRIEARSDGDGKGCEFVVRLPLLRSVEVEPPPPRPEPPRGGDGPLRILVVDDNRDAADALSRLLELDGHHVRTAYDAAGALAAAFASPPDAVLMDLGLPDKSGFDVARELRAHSEFDAALIVALTGLGRPEDRRRSREAGFARHLVKPVDADVLRGILADAARPSHDLRGDEPAAVKA